nr:hypothetical protein [uncultured Pseudogulbenkiania sp.]
MAFHPQPDYLERRAIQRSKELAGKLKRVITPADRRRTQARREIEFRREQREAQQ